MKLIHKLEPIWWMLFGGGGFVTAFFLPGLIIAVLLLGPSDLMHAGLSYPRAHALASSLVGRVFLIAVISLVLWHCAHHLRHFMLDLFGHAAAPIAAYGAYTLALLGTIATVSAVLAL
ncbi:MAG: fumarate reductase subunit FrdD [Myxococcota bacterium]